MLAKVDELAAERDKAGGPMSHRQTRIERAVALSLQVIG